MIKIALVAVSGMTFALFVGGMRREIGIWISLVSGILIFFFGIRKFEGMIDLFQTLTETTGINGNYIKVILKMMGIAYVSEFTASICRDAGQNAIAGQVDFFGKVSLIMVSLPVLQSLLETMEELLP